MEAVLEGLLFVTGEEGLSLKKIAEILEIDEDKLNQVIENLEHDYESDKRGIKLELLGNNLKLTTKKEHKKYYEKLVETDDTILSQASLETLAIIAYNQPITRVKVDEIRGIDSSYVIRKLLLKNLIKDMGRSDAPGKPILYGVTDSFLDYFGLSTIDDLPKLEEINDEDIETDLFESKYKEEISE